MTVRIIQRGSVPILRWHVLVETPVGTREDVIHDRGQLAAYLRGVKAGAASQGEYSVTDEHTVE